MDAIIHFGQSFDLMYHFSVAPQADDTVYLTRELSKLSEKERRIKDAYNHLLTVLQDPDQDYIVKGNSLRKVFDHFVYDKEAGTLDCFLNTSIEKISK